MVAGHGLARLGGAALARLVDRVRHSSERLTGPIPRVLAIAVLLPLLFSPGGEEASPSEVGYHVADGSEEAPPLQQPQRHATVADDDLRARPVVAERVETTRPHLLVRPTGSVDPEDLFTLLSLPEVAHLASTVEVEVTLEDDEGATPLQLLVVDAAAFRPLTPDVTAQSPPVWERVLDGEMVVRHDVAQEHELPLGGTVRLAADDGEGDVRIGAFASNGSPPFAEAIVPWSTGRELGISSPNLIIVSLVDDDAADGFAARIGGILTDVTVETIEPPEEEQARLVGAGTHRFESFTYVSHGDGMIGIDPDWVRSNIVTVELPIFGGTARCHRVMVPQLVAALREVQEAGLDRYIDRGDYGGCWVPRHILFDPDRRLSMHAWGLAIDFNVSTNEYGARPQLHPGIVEIFERWGFRWGGRWSVPDGMHFELDTVVEPYGRAP